MSQSQLGPLHRDRFRGALLGLAVGDALGTTVEFKPPGSFEPVTDMVGGGPFGLRPGQWTDDTSMALCLAESLLERGGFDPVDQLTRYRAWYRDGHWSSTGRCFDIGNATRKAIERFEATGEPFPGEGDPNAAGNGPLMKLAPIPMVFARHPAAAVALAADSARTTHGAAQALDAARYLAGLLVGALQGAPVSQLLHGGLYEPEPGLFSDGPLHPEVLAVAKGSFHAKQPPAIKGAGYVVAALEAALWALKSTRTFEDGALAAVNLGDDADTTAAIYGQLAGAHYGVQAIPERWRTLVHRGEEILAIADALHELSATITPTPPPHGSVGTDEPTLFSESAATTAQEPPGDAYWVHPGALLAGPYPGAPSRKEAEQKLEAFLDAGVTCFLDLTEEGEGPGRTGLHPYAQLLRTIAKRRGIKVTHQRLPIRDVDVPTDWQMRVILHALDSALKAGETVYVHCWGGVGRTGTVVGCHLVELGLDASMVPAALQGMREHTKRAHRPSPETDAQRQLIATWQPAGPATLVLDQDAIDQLEPEPFDDEDTASSVPSFERLVAALQSPPAVFGGPFTGWTLQGGQQEPGDVYLEVLDPDHSRNGPPLPASQVAVIEALGFEYRGGAWELDERGEDPQQVLEAAARRALAVLYAWQTAAAPEEPARLGPRFRDALTYATGLHAGQHRKGTAIPYIAHLLAVTATVIEDGGSEDEAIAALLHDAAEDQGGDTTLGEIGQRYGDRVARIVAECSDTSEQPKPPWRERKQAYLEHLESATTSALRVSLADKLHNARAIVRDLKAHGPAVWTRFTAGRDEQLWYYGALANVFAERRPGVLADELSALVGRMDAS